MELSQLIKSKIKAWEGCRLSAYRCPSGVLTIGFGHTGPDVTPGKLISQTEADALFETDITRFAGEIYKTLENVNLNNNQFDALVSIAYNIGMTAFKNSGLYRLVKANPDNPEIFSEFLKWRYAGGKELPGLHRRRIEEAKHYFGDV